MPKSMSDWAASKALSADNPGGFRLWGKPGPGIGGVEEDL